MADHKSATLKVINENKKNMHKKNTNKNAPEVKSRVVESSSLNVEVQNENSDMVPSEQVTWVIENNVNVEQKKIEPKPEPVKASKSIKAKTVAKTKAKKTEDKKPDEKKPADDKKTDEKKPDEQKDKKDNLTEKETELMTLSHDLKDLNTSQKNRNEIINESGVNDSEKKSVTESVSAQTEQVPKVDYLLL